MRNSRDTWRGLRSARCSVMGTPGAEGGSGRRTGRKTGTAPWPDPTRHGPAPGAGRPIVRGAEYQAGKDGREANAGRRKAAGNQGQQSVLLQGGAVDNRPDTGHGCRARKGADASQVSL